VGWNKSFYREDQKRILVRGVGRVVARVLFAALNRRAEGNSECEWTGKTHCPGGVRPDEYQAIKIVSN
jgi:hypothetical protein